jgi:hypothetical protein
VTSLAIAVFVLGIIWLAVWRGKLKQVLLWGGIILAVAAVIAAGVVWHFTYGKRQVVYPVGNGAAIFPLADAWRALSESKDEVEFANRVTPIDIPDSLKADMWKVKYVLSGHGELATKAGWKVVTPFDPKPWRIDWEKYAADKSHEAPKNGFSLTPAMLFVPGVGPIDSPDKFDASDFYKAYSEVLPTIAVQSFPCEWSGNTSLDCHLIGTVTSSAQARNVFDWFAAEKGTSFEVKLYDCPSHGSPVADCAVIGDESQKDITFPMPSQTRGFDHFLTFNNVPQRKGVLMYTLEVLHTG